MKKTAKILAILLVMLTVVQFPVTAFASTKTGCNFNSNTYTHQTKFDNQQIHQGIDVSSHNESLDYSKIKASGVEFVIVRVGYRGYGSKGNVLKDKYFEENIESAKKAGLKVGAYFYTQATTEAEAEYEANFVLEYIKKYDLDLPVFYDIEFAEDSNGFTGRLYNANLSKAKMTNLALAFCDTIENAGYKAGVYASKSFFEDEMNSSTLEAKEYVIWLAHYTTSTKYAGDYKIWQFSDTGKISGINGMNFDCNFLYGDMKFGDLATVDAIPNQKYTGSAITPSVSVSFKNKKLVENEDYTLKYSNNVNVGTASVKITGINDYENTLDRTVTFDIVPTGVTNFVVSASNENSVSLKWDANKNASAYKLQIYKNKSWSTLAKTDKTSYTVKNLSSASDYKFRVAPYKTINSYDYTGSYVYATGTTYPAKVSSLSSTAISSNYITLSWTKQKSATGYRVYKYNYSKKAYEYYKEIPSGSTNTLKVTALSANTKYKFRVRAYKTDTNGKRLYGSYCSGVTFYTAPATPTLKSATSSSSKKVKVKWKSVSGVSGYQVRWSTTKDFSSNYKSTLVDASNTSTTIKTASSKKYYYVKVRSYKTRNGEREYSSWSKIIKVWVK